MRELRQNELEAVAGGPLFIPVIIVPTVKLTTAAKTAAVALGGAAGIAGAQTALSNNDSE